MLASLKKLLSTVRGLVKFFLPKCGVLVHCSRFGEVNVLSSELRTIVGDVKSRRLVELRNVKGI